MSTELVGLLILAIANVASILKSISGIHVLAMKIDLVCEMMENLEGRVTRLEGLFISPARKRRASGE